MTDLNTRSALRSPRSTVLAAVALLAVGGGAGAIAMHATNSSVTMAPATPVAIRSLSSSGITTVKGRVAEIYGNKFIIMDASGRALVDTGREGESGSLVTVGEPVTVQGRFDRGFVHAAFLVGPENKVVSLEPLGGRHDGHDRHNGRHTQEDGPGAPPTPIADRDDDALPPAPVPAPDAAAPVDH